MQVFHLQGLQTPNDILGTLSCHVVYHFMVCPIDQTKELFPAFGSLEEQVKLKIIRTANRRSYQANASALILKFERR